MIVAELCCYDIAMLQVPLFPQALLLKYVQSDLENSHYSAV